MEGYAGEIPQAATKAKNDKRFEGGVGIGIGRFTLETHQKSFRKRLRTCVGQTVVDKFNTCCDALLILFFNNYLRHGLKN